MANGTNRIRLIQKSQPDTETPRIKLVSNGKPLTLPKTFTTTPRVGGFGGRGKRGDDSGTSNSGGVRLGSFGGGANKQTFTTTTTKPATMTTRSKEEIERELEIAREAHEKASGEFVRNVNMLLVKDSRDQIDELMRAMNEARAAVDLLEKELKYTTSTHDDDFFGQFGANYDAGRLAQDTNAAYNAYLANPTEENKARADALAMLEQQFLTNNAAALDDENAKATWITKSAAGYLPQLIDQTLATVGGGAAGALGGAGVGSVIPVVGTGTGAVWGARAGAVAASGAYSYGQMRGAAYRELINAGVDEETARAAANDEAVISALIEMGDTAWTVMSLGTGKLLETLGKGGIKAVAGESAEIGGKKLLKELAKFGIKDVGQEWAEEGLQKGVSIANQNRDNTGMLNLAGETVGTLWDAATGKNMEARDEILDAANEGAKIALMFGGTGRAIDIAGSNLARAKIGKSMQSMGGVETVQAMIETGLESDKNTESYQLAVQMKAKLDSGKTLSNIEIGRLQQANVKAIEAEASQSASDGLMDLARETVTARENAAQTQADAAVEGSSRSNVPYNVLSMENPVRKARDNAIKNTGYGENGNKSFTASLVGNGNGQVNAEIAPAAAQTAKETAFREPVEAIRMANAQAAQQNEKTAAETQPDVSKPNTGKKAPGFYDNGRFYGTDEDAQYLDRMAKAAGISIEMVEATDGSNGWIVNGEAYLSENAEDPLRVVAKHEITHHLQDAAGEAYREYRSYVEQIYRDRGTLDQQIKAIQQLYRKNGKELSREAALDELAADYAGELLENEELIRKLAGENPSLGQRILNAIRELLRRFRTAFSSAEVKQLDRAARLWEAALVDANAAYQRGEVAATNNTRYSTAEVNAETADLDAMSRDEEMERQSVKGSRDLQKQIDALERQNKRLKEQMKRTDVPKVRREVVKRSAKDLRSMYSSKIDLDVLTDRIEALYNKISARSGSGSLQELNGVPTWAEVRAEARSIADAILAESRGNVNPMAEEYSEIRKELRGRKISISDEYRADLESAGGYEGIRRQNFGTFSLTKDGTPIDTVYEELNEKYPVLFPDGIVHPADQLVRLSDVMQELKAVEGNPFENDLDATAQYLAGEIEERFYDTPNQKPTLADKMANTYHQQRLRDQKQLRAKLADQRRAYEKQVDEIHTRYANENRKRIENQNAAQRRETIYRHANRLGKMLERPTDKRHIPEQLRGAALHMLRYINTESNYQLAKGADGKYHRTDPMEVLYQRMYGGEASDVKETGRTAAARALKAVYDDILKEGELSVDPDIGDYLEELAKMGNKPLGDMTRAELDTVWRVMQVVEHSITKANELHSEGRYRTVESMANALSEGVGNRKDRTNWAGPAGMVDQLLNRDMITPETFFHVLGDIGENIFRQMRNSADRQTAIVKEGSERAAKLIRESGVEFKKADKEHHTFHLDGGDLTLSTSQLMELYALSKRKQAMEHIYIGGLKSVGGVKGLKQTGRSKPVKVTPADVSTMLETLTDKQKALMDGLQAYLSGDLAKHGNEESLKVYGYEKFKEKNYWPIKVSRTETKSDPTSEARSKTIPGYGMTKAVIPKASNSVELRSAIDTFAAHLNQMATYASWLGTNEDVTRLHNFKFTGDQNRADGTVKELFERVYGKKGSAYLDALLSDIAQGTKTGADKSVIEGMFSRWKAAKVGGNLRVIVQQPTAILRAMSIINPKYLAVAKNPLAGWKKALKYSPIAQWKDWGYFEMDTGRSIRELITGTESNLDKAKNAFMWGAGAADSVAWGHLWNAVEAETADKHEELSKGSKEFYDAVADRFAEVIDRTQVVDSVLHRTQIMRSNSYAAKISTSFMSEPSKIYNMVVRDLYDLKNAGSDEKKAAATKQLARTSSALIVSFAINAAAQALVDGLRDDDRDKKYGEKFAEALPGNFASNFNPVSYIPYFKDVWSLIEGYTLDRSDMEGISDLVNAVGQLGKAMMGESEKTVLNAGLNAACRLGDLLGIPVSNLKRDAAAIFDTVLSDAELFELQYEVDKLLYNQDNASGVFYGDLYRSMNNDYDAYENIYEDMYEGMVERGVSEDDAEEDIASAMESRMKKELGVESVKSLPVRYSPPTSENPEDPFFALIKKARENDTGWIEQLDPGSIEIAHAVDEVRDQKAIEKIKVIASQPYGEELKKLAMRNVMSESLWGRYLKALNAGVTSKQYAEFLEAIAKEATKRTGKPDATATKADVEAVLYRSKLSNAKKRAIWESYGWKAESPW